MSVERLESSIPGCRKNKQKVQVRSDTSTEDKPRMLDVTEVSEGKQRKFLNNNKKV